VRSRATRAADRNVLGLIKPYFERAPLAALALGISSGFPYAMIGATLTTRLAQDGIDKRTITAFSLAFLMYNAKVLWSWAIDVVPMPQIGRRGQRVWWMLIAGLMVIAAVINLALVDPSADLQATILAAVLVGFAGATFDIVIDAYRIELLKPEQLGIGAGMSQYGWRIGSTLAAALALVIAARVDWRTAYLVCAAFALPAMLTALILGEPERRQTVVRASHERWLSLKAIVTPFLEFFARRGAWLVLAFVLLHKIGDTLATLTVRLLFDSLGYSNDEIAIYDVGIGFWALLIGVFVGGLMYARLGLMRSVAISLVLMAISNLSFAGLAATGHSNWAMAGAIGFENFASGIGGVTVVAYFSSLCDLRFTAVQFALISAASSVMGRIVTGTSAGALIERFGYVDFYLLTTLIALPGIALFWLLARRGLVEPPSGPQTERS
jgi:MFS transporter, PAT family, beta-lactamase induction signal transducer AmpG